MKFKVLEDKGLIAIRGTSRRDSESAAGLPNVGEILKRLRTQRGYSLREVAEASDLSPSFLSAVERGESDIALGRLARIAQFFEHDIGSLLGYTTRRARPRFVGPEDRMMVDRGKGVRYEVLRLPDVGMEIIIVDFEPHAGFDVELVHAGVDIVYVTSGEVVLSVGHVDYPMKSGESAVYSAAYAHGVRNVQDAAASLIGVTTESMY
jgi:transcriptional regulator with XRE-family HTH domain